MAAWLVAGSAERDSPSISQLGREMLGAARSTVRDRNGGLAAEQAPGSTLWRTVVLEVLALDLGPQVLLREAEREVGGTSPDRSRLSHPPPLLAGGRPESGVSLRPPITWKECTLTLWIAAGMTLPCDRRGGQH